MMDAGAVVERDSIEAMLRPMAHRGPDGNGIHLDHHVGLGHLRLSIIDLSLGNQPMTNEDGTVWLVFNGEIYNYLELRSQLIARGHKFKTHSDTEVIIHLYEEKGPACVNELRGMFAFAIWDAKKQRLFVARDRLGIKPLYYCQTRDALYFASELKGIIADKKVSREVNRSAIRQFLSFTYVAGEETLFKSIRKLMPGHYLLMEGGRVIQRQYWDLGYPRERWSMPWEEAVGELHGLLERTVRDHMIADVPVGVLLSGGVDSSAILSYAVRATDKPVSTFTIGFDGNQVVDERPYAKLCAAKYGTRHHELSISAGDFWDFLPSYVWHMEEPVCEAPAVSLYYISKLAREHVKVLLSGEGGDEAFGGYPNYPNMMRLEKLRAATGPFARTAGMAVSMAGKVSGDKRLERYGSALGRSLSSQYFSRTSGPSSFFNRNAATFLTPEFASATASVSPAAFIQELCQAVGDEPLLNQMLYIDTKTWLPDDLLVKADKMTMANSVELRVPMLDHKVLEFAATLPINFKVEGKETKRILKAALAKELPPEVINRKKAGFPIPYSQWLRGDLKIKVDGILLSEKAVSRGYFKPAEVKKLIKANSGNGSFSKEIFGLLALELWHHRFVDAV